MARKEIHPLHRNVHPVLSWTVLGIGLFIAIIVVGIGALRESNPDSFIGITPQEATVSASTGVNTIAWKTYVDPSGLYSFQYPSTFSVSKIVDEDKTVRSISITDMTTNTDGSLTRDNNIEPDITVHSPMGTSTYPVLKGFMMSVSKLPYLGQKDALWTTINGNDVYINDQIQRGKNNLMRETIVDIQKENAGYEVGIGYNMKHPAYNSIFEHVLQTFTIK